MTPVVAEEVVTQDQSEVSVPIEKTEDEEIKGYEDFEGIEEEWEDFNKRDANKSKTKK